MLILDRLYRKLQSRGSAYEAGYLESLLRDIYISGDDRTRRLIEFHAEKQG